MNIQKTNAGLSAVNNLSAIRNQPKTDAKTTETSLSSAIHQAKGDTSIRTFMGEMKQAMKSGTFDATKFAENAPQALKDIAAKEGISLKDEFSAMHQQFSKQNSIATPPTNALTRYNDNAISSTLSQSGKLSLSA